MKKNLRFGSFRSLEPITHCFGFEGGLCIDRYYIDGFMAQHSGDVRGHVLEIGDDAYTRRFGEGKVTQSAVLCATEGNPEATLVADLTDSDHLPSDTFDCIICTQTLQYIYEVQKAVQTIHRLLKPEGAVLATFPSIAHISRYDMEHWGEYWRFTSMAAERLFEGAFLPGNVEVYPYGNVLTATAFLHGLPAEKLKKEELDHRDRDYEVVIAVRAVKSKGK